MTQQVQEGRIYKGEIVSIKDFGAFVEIAPETDGLLHVSEISNNYVERVGDHLKVGDSLEVKVIRIDEQGRIKLSRKAVLEERGESDDIGVPRKPKSERSEDGDEGEGNGGGGRRRSGGGGGGGGRGRDRGGDRGDRGSRNGGSSEGNSRDEAPAEASSDEPRRRRRRGPSDD